METSKETLAHWLSDDLCGDCAIRCPADGSTITYRQLRQQALLTSRELWTHGIGKGDVVALALPNGPEFVISFLAVAGLGAIAAPLNPSYTVNEFAFYLKDSAASLVIKPPGDHAAAQAARDCGIPICEARWSCDPGMTLEHNLSELRTLGDPPPPDPDDVALFLHTSGTTGRPKGVPLTHANLFTSMANISDCYRLGPGDVSLLVMPLFHVHGLIGVCLSTLHSGGALVVPPRFSASAFWQQVQAHGVTWYSAVPTIHQVLLRRADDEAARRGGLRFIRSCSSSLAPATMRGLEERFESPVLQAYGMTEASHQVASNPLPPNPRIPGSVGRATGIEICIMDQSGRQLPCGTRGEVAIRGANVMRGYHQNPAANEAAFAHGWFRTGDEGSLNGSGYLALTGRIKELINRGGEKISPVEVDAVLLEHPAVAEAAAFGVPDTKYGEEIHAAVVLKGPATTEEILGFCRERLAEFKVPKAIHVTDTLPGGDTGKIQRSLFARRFHR